ncbi:MAG: DUF4388 domain-containing protein [Deltaproteobacteria bacterium]|nr:MAG: DUF4388 domain-containing protein [Deltaproteobacteria bacterium]
MIIRVEAGEVDLLTASPEVLEQLGLGAKEPLLASGAQGVAVLAGRRAPGFFAGDLRTLGVAEAMNLINSGRRHGLAVFDLSGGRKVLHFDEGEVVFAASTFEHDRLGEALWRAGFVDLAKLEAIQGSLPPGKRLGEYLVERGLVSSAELYRGLVRQVRDIVLSLFHFRSGRLLFIEGAQVTSERVQLEQPTAELILEGLRQVDDLARLRERISLETVYVAREPGPGMTLNAQELAVLRLTTGVHTAREVLQASQLGEFDAMKALSTLVEAGLLVARHQADASRARADHAERTEAGQGTETTVSLHPPAEVRAEEPERTLTATSPVGREEGPPAEGLGESTEVGTLPELPRAGLPTLAVDTEPATFVDLDPGGPPSQATRVDRVIDLSEVAERMPFLAYTKSIRKVWEVLSKAGADPAALQSYFEQAPPEYRKLFQGASLEGGTFTTVKVLENARHAYGEGYKSKAMEALDAFQAFALFQARNTLSPEAAGKLERLVMLYHLGKA